jgi:hypothetical protein
VRGDRDETDDVCVPASLLKKDSVRESAISRSVWQERSRMPSSAPTLCQWL